MSEEEIIDHLTLFNEDLKELEANEDFILQDGMKFNTQEAIQGLLDLYNKEKEKNSKYIVNLTDEQYRKLVETIRNEINKEWEDKIREKIEALEKEKKNYTFAGAFVDGQIGILKRLLEE